MKKIKLTIEGMHCAACSGNVEKSIKKLEGVSEVRVSVMTHKSIVEAEDNVSIEDVKNAVSNVGYKVINAE
jgi:Cu+-exporting ATPase|tara:strand:+ start:200 stop:412 length:213 start_codon:yes stop_codon:yes gene_type:complete